MTLEERFGAVDGLASPTSGTATTSATRLCSPPHSRRALHRRDAQGLPAQARHHSQGDRDRREHRRLLTLTRDPVKAATGADAIYTDVCTRWARNTKPPRAPIFKPFQVNDELMSHAQSAPPLCTACPRTAMPKSPTLSLTARNPIVFDQAENRVHAQKAITLMLLGGAKRLPKTPNRRR